MKMNRNILISFLLLVIVGALYRLFPRPVNFAPQIAMAIFAGAVIKDKRLAILLPVLSMFISDALFQLLYIKGWSAIPGFYEGQWQNYLLFAAMCCIGFMIRKINVKNVLVASVAAPTVFFLLSNFVVWAGWQGARGLGRPKTFQGLLLCYNDGLPFYGNSVWACMFFSAILFGSYVVMRKRAATPAVA